MFTPKLFLWASASLLTLLTTGLFGLQPQTPQTDVDDLVQRVEVLETQVAVLSTRVAELEAATPEPTEEPAEADSADDEAEVEALVPTATPKLPLAEYEPILSDVEALPCEYDAFDDMDNCGLLKGDAYTISDWAYQDDGSIVTVSLWVEQPAGKAPVLDWFVTYSGEDWIFLDGIIVLYDGERYTVKINRLLDRYSEVIDGGVIEAFSVPVESMEAVVDMLVAEDVQVRLTGEQNSVEKQLSSVEREIMFRALAAYEQRGGQLPDNREKLLELLPDQEEVGQGAESDNGSSSLVGATVAPTANLRSGPGTSYDVVGQSQQGDSLEIVGQSDDGTWYELSDGAWIAVSLVEIAESEQEPLAIETIVEPYESPVGPWDVVQWSKCLVYDPERYEFPVQIVDSSRVEITMLTYASIDGGELSVNLYTEDGTLVDEIYQGIDTSEPISKSVDLPLDTTDYVFVAEVDPGCWYVIWSAKE